MHHKNYTYTIAQIVGLSGVSAVSVYADIKRGKLVPGNLENVSAYIQWRQLAKQLKTKEVEDEVDKEII